MNKLTKKLNPEDFYYVEKENGDICIKQANLYASLKAENPALYVDFDDNDIKEVISSVPSYEEFQNLKNYEKIIQTFNNESVDYSNSVKIINKLINEKNELTQKIHILTESQMNLENEIGKFSDKIIELKKLLNKYENLLKNCEEK